MVRKTVTELTRVSDTERYAEAFPRHIKLEDFLGIDLVIDATRLVKGEKATYVVFEGRFADDDSPLVWSCGGIAIVRYFGVDFDQTSLPMLAAFSKGEGDMWLMG